MKKAATLAILALASVALVACGSSSSSSTSTESTSTSGESAGSGAEKPTGGGGESGGGGGSIVKMATPPGTELAFTTKHATAKAGQVSIEFENPQELQHNVAIENSSGEKLGETELVEKGKATATVNLKPGTYTFFCTVPGHRQAGMEGTLTVK
jgi:plastocyanin